MQELERGDSGVRSFASVQGALVMYPIFAFGSEEQKRHWLPKMAAGEVDRVLRLTEPDYGSNPAGMITTARETKSGWILNGARCGSPTIDRARGDHLGQDRQPTTWNRSAASSSRPTRRASREDQKGSSAARQRHERAGLTGRVRAERRRAAESAGLKSPLLCLTPGRATASRGEVGRRWRVTTRR